MAKVLFLAADPYPTHASVSRQLATEFLKVYISRNVRDEIKVLNLCEETIPAVDYAVLNAWDNIAAGTPVSDFPRIWQDKLKSYDALSEEFFSADKYVAVFPSWNLTVPPQLVSYLLSALPPSGKNKIPNGENKKVLLICSSAYICSDTAAPNYCAGVDWLKRLFKLCGVEDFDAVFAEGMEQFPENREEIIKNAKVAVQVYAKTF
ncbi:MAG: NAD(P)H-dependent oxidoreductase [Oscillospiraceae bacterium]|jgi:FMN-dependent NADH-azoreductase|nr:NAD(P)H-dependent oxidoreductase [Oscillospiraceae bacterium]